MKKNIIVAIILIIIVIVGMIFILSNNAEERAIDKITIRIKEGTLTRTGATIIFTDKNGMSYGYEEWFIIEEKVNNEWKEVETIDSAYEFNDIAWKLDNNGIIEKNINWSKIYGELEKGNYRFVKRIYDGEYKYFFVEFYID